MQGISRRRALGVCESWVFADTLWFPGNGDTIGVAVTCQLQTSRLIGLPEELHKMSVVQTGSGDGG